MNPQQEPENSSQDITKNEIFVNPTQGQNSGQYSSATIYPWNPSVPPGFNTNFLRYDGNTSLSSPESTNYNNMNPIIQGNMIPDYEGPKHIYPIVNQLPRAFPAYSPGSSQYRFLSQYPFSSNYINNGCSNYSYMSSMDRNKSCPSLQPTSNSTYQDLLREHNYTRQTDNSKVDVRLEEFKNMKRSSTDFLAGETDRKITDINNDIPSKKKKTTSANREALMNPISKGFTREVILLETPGQESRKTVIYRTPDGKTLNKKPDVKNYLTTNSFPDLKPEMFSFDSRLSLTPKKPRELNGKKASLTDNGAILLPKKNKDLSITQGRKSLHIRHKKLISKHFKKSVEESKFLDGANSGSYRRKLPALSKLSIAMLTENGNFTQEWNVFYADSLCVYEFISNFSKFLCLEIKVQDVFELITSVQISSLEDSLFVRLLSFFLKFAIISDNFAHEINTLFFIDNVYSLKWDWLLLNEIFRLYIHSKSRLFFEATHFSDLEHPRLLKELVDTLNDGASLYVLRPSLKMSSLRFLVDQINNSNSFAAYINDIVEGVCKNRRDKFHLDTQLRLLKLKINTSSTGNQSNSDQNSNKSQGKNENGSNEDLQQIKDYEKSRESLKSDIKSLNSSLRVLNLGMDRFCRQFLFSSNQKIIFVEGTSNFVSMLETKFSSGKRSFKGAYVVESNSVQDIIMLNSDEMAEYNIPQSFDDGFPALEESLAPPFDEYKKNIIRMLFDSPKLIRNVSEEELELFVILFTQNLSKQKKKVIAPNEFSEGWWQIVENSKMNEFCKALNQRGVREHHLLKAFSKHQDVLSDVSIDNREGLLSIRTFNYSSAQNVSVPYVKDLSNNLILEEISEISRMMDRYLDKIGIESTDSLFSHFQTRCGIIPTPEPKIILSELVSSFCQNCERKFDRPWFSKWNESFELYSSLPTIYLYCQSLKLKIDPNCKVCKICGKSDENLMICECHVCSTAAHDKCLDQPMKKYKKGKMICLPCFNESVSKSSRTCRACHVKTGKTSMCGGCSEYFHSKCMGNKLKKKDSPPICEACVTAEKINNPKVYDRPKISFANGSFKKYSNECQTILKTLKENKDSTPFHLPVDESIPSYYQVIKKPMDFWTMEEKIKSNKYKNVTQFYNDIIQIFENCHIFNEDQSKIAKSGARLQKLFEKEWCKVASTFST